ncbi:MAG: hypothetical protein JW829_17795, partial [Pirellulales bacterium]|nr:hypothetical protein [Pirellulales bacterium]
MNIRYLVCSAFLSLVTCATSQLNAVEQPGSQQWEQEIRAFEALDRVRQPPQEAILFIGSSTIRRWETLAQDFPEHKVVNRGFGGCQIVDC